MGEGGGVVSSSPPGSGSEFMGSLKGPPILKVHARRFNPAIDHEDFEDFMNEDVELVVLRNRGGPGALGSVAVYLYSALALRSAGTTPMSSSHGSPHGIPSGTFTILGPRRQPDRQTDEFYQGPRQATTGHDKPLTILRDS